MSRWSKKTLLTLVKQATKNIQLLKSGCKLHRAVVFKIQDSVKSRGVSASAEWVAG